MRGPGALERPEVRLPVGAPTGCHRRGREPVRVDTSVVKPWASFGVRKGSSNDRQRRVRVQVDEARAEDESGAVDDLARLRRRPVAHPGRHEGDPPLLDGDVASAAACGELPRASSIHGRTNMNWPCTAADRLLALIIASVRLGVWRPLGTGPDQWRPAVAHRASAAMSAASARAAPENGSRA